MDMTIKRVPGVLAKTGKCRTRLYDDIKKGLWPRPVQLGVRGSGWPSYECDAMNTARIAGLTDADLRALVSLLESARTAVHLLPLRLNQEAWIAERVLEARDASKSLAASSQVGRLSPERTT